MTRSHPGQRIPLLLSAPQPCSYLENRSSSSAFVDPGVPMDMPLYGRLVRVGFRRSGALVYRPQCPTCQQCLALRLPVEQFRPRRRHRRALQKNRDVRLVTCDARLQAEHFALYQRYTASRHGEGIMAESTPTQYMDFLTAPWSETLFVELREEKRLLGVAVTDRLGDGLSAVYTFFEPGLGQRSLGTFAVLSQLSMARQLGLPHLYLGYWIRDCGKMAYKADYRPVQLFSGEQWRTFGQGEEIDVPELAPVHP